MCYNISVNIGTSPPDEIMCFDEVRQAERLSRILFCINLENKMAINKTYEELVESAKPKLTTDDCYTPDNVYSVVRDYVAERYGLDPETFVRHSIRVEIIRQRTTPGRLWWIIHHFQFCGRS